MKIKITHTEGNWQFGTIGGIKFYVQVFDEPSGYGINDGRISRLWIDGMANYDRGWDNTPTTPKAKQRVKELLEHFDKPQQSKDYEKLITEAKDKGEPIGVIIAFSQDTTLPWATFRKYYRQAHLRMLTEFKEK